MKRAVLITLFLLVLASGCTQKAGNTSTNETTEYTRQNVSTETYNIPVKDFTFKIIGLSEFKMKPGEKTRFYLVFNNIDEDKEAHKFVARVLPSAVDFDAKASYKCLYFANCPQLHYDMNSWINQTREGVWINYTKVGFQRVGIEIPENAKKGTYIYDVVACEDINFDQCNRSSANWGPTLSLTVQILGT